MGDKLLYYITTLQVFNWTSSSSLRWQKHRLAVRAEGESLAVAVGRGHGEGGQLEEHSGKWYSLARAAAHHFKDLT